MLRVEGTNELRFAAAYFGRLDKPTKAAIRKEARTWGPLLVREAIVGASSRDKVSVAVAQSGKVTSSNRGLVATFGSTGRYKGRTPLANLAAPYEFGGDREKVETYYARHRISRRAMKVSRHAQRQLSPRRRKGYFIMSAVADTTPTLVGMWVRAIADVASEATS
jgi:hypothetical protein